ncbi:Caskin-2 [Merluccius polli]|uniref:Caskin-2 n=1 Tax=Merluccius polli TaxID=89951 RepID=A0AA47MIU1_MERPO|nr:Caskin-2 [Merluccius polli]
MAVSTGHQKKLMLAVKRLTDLQRARNHGDQAGGGTLRRKPPAVLELVAVEHNAHQSPDGPAPRTPRALASFQDCELSAELQSAMTGRAVGGEAFGIRVAPCMSVSQESIGMRSRGSGNSGNSGKSHSGNPSINPSGNHSGNPPDGRVGALVSCSTTHHSQECLESGGEKGRHGGGDSPGRRSHTPTRLNYVPLTPPLTPSKMPRFAYPGGDSRTRSWLHLPVSCPPSPGPQASPGPEAISYLHPQAAPGGGARGGAGSPARLFKPLAGAVLLPVPRPGQILPQHAHQQQAVIRRDVVKMRSQSLTRDALSDGEPDDDEDNHLARAASSSSSSSSSVPSYATLGRSNLPGGGSQWPQLNRSQSFAVRSRRKGPPPPPPKRMSSVSGPGVEPSSFGGAEPSSFEGVEPSSYLGAEVEVEVESVGSMRSIAARLEGGGVARLEGGGGVARLEGGGGVARLEGGGGVARLEGGGMISPSRRMDVPPGRETLCPQMFPRPHPPAPSKAAPALGPAGLWRTGRDGAEGASERRTERGGGKEGAAEDKERSRRSGQPGSTVTTNTNTSAATTAVVDSPKKSSGLGLPFAEEGNLTIRQRPKFAPRQDSDTEAKAPPSEGPVQTPKPLELPEFNLKESDTVKRRPKYRDGPGPPPEGVEGGNSPTRSFSMSGSPQPVRIFQKACSVGGGPLPQAGPPRRASIPKLTSVQVHTASARLDTRLRSNAAVPRPPTSPTELAPPTRPTELAPPTRPTELAPPTRPGPGRQAPVGGSWTRLFRLCTPTGNRGYKHVFSTGGLLV